LEKSSGWFGNFSLFRSALTPLRATSATIRQKHERASMTIFLEEALKLVRLGVLLRWWHKFIMKLHFFR